MTTILEELRFFADHTDVTIHGDRWKRFCDRVSAMESLAETGLAAKSKHGKQYACIHCGCTDKTVCNWPGQGCPEVNPQLLENAPNPKVPKRDMVFQLAKKHWTPPFSYDEMGTRITDKNGNLILDVRGWGRLSGTGSHGLALNEAEAMAIQDEIGVSVANLLTSKWPK